MIYIYDGGSLSVTEEEEKKKKKKKDFYSSSIRLGLSTQLEGPVVLWTSFRCAEAFRSFSPSGGFFSVKIVTFEPLWVPQSHQSG